MSADSSDQPPLPADVNDWPTDPQTLLGVSSDISRRDLKRAYARLIKKYKPEHAPEEFRRLRAAYEKLDQQLEWREEYDLRRRLFADESQRSSNDTQARPTEPTTDAPNARNDETPLATSEADTGPTDIEASEVNLGRTGSRRQEESRPKNPDELWQWALDGGDLPQIYAELLGWRQRRPPTEIDFARLYWLTTLVPDLEPDRDPCTWLIEGLRHHRSSTRLFEMLETEVRRRDGQVPAVLEDSLLDHGDVAWRRVNLAELRWYAARRQSRFDVISKDFQSLKRTFLDEPDQWLRLLNVGLRQVVISHSVSLLEELRQELKQAPSQAGDNWIWDSLDADLALDKAWSHGTDILRAALTGGVVLRLQMILDLIETTWQVSVADAREPVLRFSQELAEFSERSLLELALIEQRARPLLKRLQELFAQQLALAGIDHRTDLTPAVQQELERFIRNSFPIGSCDNLNTIVMEHCLFQAVTPHDISRVLAQMTVEVPDEYFVIAEKLTTNLALNCVVDANRLLW